MRASRSTPALFSARPPKPKAADSNSAWVITNSCRARPRTPWAFLLPPPNQWTVSQIVSIERIRVGRESHRPPHPAVAGVDAFPYPDSQQAEEANILENLQG